MNDEELIAQNVAKMRAKGATDEQVRHYLTLEGLTPKNAQQPTQHSASTDQEQETPLDRVRGLVQNATSGLTFGASPKIIAAANAVLPHAMGGTRGFDYKGALEDELSSMKTFDDRHPVASKVANVAGSILPIVATGGAGGAGEDAGLLARLGNTAMQGAKYGALTGALSSNKISDVIPNTLEQGALGIAGNLLLHSGGELIGGGAKALGIPQGISKGATAASNWLGGESPLASVLQKVGVATGKTGAANSAIAKRLAWSGETPQGLMGKINQEGSPEMLADLNPQLRSLTKAATKTPGPGQAQIVDAITQRNVGTRQRLLDALKGHLPEPGGNPELETMIRNRDASANVLFPKAYRSGAPLDDPELSELLQRPTFSKAYQMAQTMAKDEGRKLPTKVVTELSQEAKDYLSTLPADQRVLAEPAFLKNPQMQVTKEVPVPDIQTAAYVDRALRRMVNGGFEGNSPIVDPGHANALQSAFGDFRDIIASKSPEYQTALHDFAVRSEPIDALNTGMNFGKYTNPGSQQVPEQALGTGDPRALAMTRKGLPGLQKGVENMSPLARNNFRAGAHQSLINEINQVPAGANGSTNSILGNVFEDSPFAQEGRSLMFDSPSPQPQFERLLGRERNMANTPASFGGSDTQANFAEDAANKNMGGFLQAILHPKATAISALSGGNENLGQGVYKALGPKLSAQGPLAVKGVLDEVMQAQQARQYLGQSGELLRNLLVPQLPSVGSNP